jgi:hypothetical protein
MDGREENPPLEVSSRQFNIQTTTVRTDPKILQLWADNQGKMV